MPPKTTALLVHTQAYSGIPRHIRPCTLHVPGHFRVISKAFQQMRPPSPTARHAVSRSPDVTGVMSMWNSMPSPLASRSRVLNVGS